MTKVTLSQDDATHICTKCGKGLTYSETLGRWVCEACLYSAYLTAEAQKEAQKRWRQSSRGVQKRKEYEQSEKGKVARERYLKSDKYKARRKEYNQRLKESLAIARVARDSQSKAQTLEEKQRDLIADIVEFMFDFDKPPKPADVVEWAQDEYSIKLNSAAAKQLILQATKELLNAD